MPAPGAQSIRRSQFLVGASRQRDAPHSEFVGAAHGPAKQSKFQPGRCFAPDASGSEMNENVQNSTMQTTLFQSGPLSKQCGLTGRSTGHFVAGRVWASFHSRPNPARHKMPVSFNVRPHRNLTAPWIRMPSSRIFPRCGVIFQSNQHHRCLPTTHLFPQ